MADFSVISCEASRSVLAPENTIDITMSIKNTFGSKITKFGLSLCFTNEDMGYSGSGFWVPVVQPETPISWANSATMTFSWSITPDAIMSQPLYSGNYQTVKNRLSALRTLPFRLQIVGAASDGSYPSLVYWVMSRMAATSRTFLSMTALGVFFSLRAKAMLSYTDRCGYRA